MQLAVVATCNGKESKGQVANCSRQVAMPSYNGMAPCHTGNFSVLCSSLMALAGNVLKSL
eukprot:755416-Pelagomonas_calceolata.AAC.2